MVLMSAKVQVNVFQYLKVSFMKKQICKNAHRFDKNKSFYGCISVVFVADVCKSRVF